MKDKWTRHEFRRTRVRDKIRKVASGLPRLSVHRSLKYFYAQVIDDQKGVTLAYATSRPAGAKSAKSAKNMDSAKSLGKSIAEQALKAGVSRVVFDRGGNVYHGRIKALAEAARAAGLKF